MARIRRGCCRGNRWACRYAGPCCRKMSATSRVGRGMAGSARSLARVGLGLAVEVVQGTDGSGDYRSEEHTSELQSLRHLVCRLLLEKKKTYNRSMTQAPPACTNGVQSPTCTSP